MSRARRLKIREALGVATPFLYTAATEGRIGIAKKLSEDYAERLYPRAYKYYEESQIPGKVEEFKKRVEPYARDIAARAFRPTELETEKAYTMGYDISEFRGGRRRKASRKRSRKLSRKRSRKLSRKRSRKSIRRSAHKTRRPRK